MKYLIIIIVFINQFISCQSSFEASDIKTVSDSLSIVYKGEADVVQFKMIEGLHQILRRDSITGNFEGDLVIPNINNAVFTYEIISHKQDTNRKMVEIKPRSDMIYLNNIKAVQKDHRFLWVGNNRIKDYQQSKTLTGSLRTNFIKSQFLNKERKITTYTPKNTNSDIPIIYFTDGGVVNRYAPYVDYLININRITPIKLVGIHPSLSSRYEEYIKGSLKNEIFDNHNQFVLNEVLESSEKEISKWAGKRYMYGFSNGAAYCMFSGINNPNMFEEIVAFSTTGYISAIAQKTNPIKFELTEYPNFYIGAGKYETNIFNDNLEFIKMMKKKDIQFNFKKFTAGHDYNTWLYEFLEYLEIRFGK